MPARDIAPAADLSEPRQEAERRASKVDHLANRPALAFGYHTPHRDSAEFFAMGLLDQLLLQGDDSLLHRELVRRRGITAEVTGGMNFLGNMYSATTPLLWSGSLVHDIDTSPDAILDAVDEALAPAREGKIDLAQLERARVKARSAFYDQMAGARYPGIGRADLLACFALFDDDPTRINGIDERYDAVTPELLAQTASEYLRPSNRTVVALEAGASNE
jgi:zinc protease